MHRRLRLALVGQATFFETCLPPASRALEPSFHEFRRDADAERLVADVRAARPDVVCVFRPDVIPAQKSSTPVPTGVTGPIPVTTTRSPIGLRTIRASARPGRRPVRRS